MMCEIAFPVSLAVHIHWGLWFDAQSDTSRRDYLPWPILQGSPLPDVREPESDFSEAGNNDDLFTIR